MPTETVDFVLVGEEEDKTPFNEDRNANQLAFSTKPQKRSVDKSSLYSEGERQASSQCSIDNHNSLEGIQEGGAVWGKRGEVAGPRHESQ